jgi:hypothetical protein
MTTPAPIPDQNSHSTKIKQRQPSVFDSLSGAVISGVIAIGLYFLTSSIAQSFASKPLASANPVAINISVAVRTLVVGMSTLATTIFGVTAVGLVCVAIAVAVKQLTNRTNPPSDAQ